MGNLGKYYVKIVIYVMQVYIQKQILSILMS